MSNIKKIKRFDVDDSESQAIFFLQTRYSHADMVIVPKSECKLIEGEDAYILEFPKTNTNQITN
jgi:hypothetical protein